MLYVSQPSHAIKNVAQSINYKIEIFLNLGLILFQAVILPIVNFFKISSKRFKSIDKKEVQLKNIKIHIKPVAVLGSLKKIAIWWKAPSNLWIPGE